MASKSAELRELLRHRATLVARERHRAGFLYKSYETFVLAYGRDYEPKPLDRAERAHVQRLLRDYRKFWGYGFKYNLCFANAQRLLPFDKPATLIYVEGFVWAYGGDDRPEGRRFDHRESDRISRGLARMGAFSPRSKRGRFSRSLPLRPRGGPAKV